MNNSAFCSKHRFFVILILTLMLQLFAALYFCNQKQGFHNDEYYSYYSSNATYGLTPTDEEWKSTDEIISEFQVAKNERFSYGMVALMQSYDVHPPLYYFILHTVCSLTPDIFSKWQGLSINLVFFMLTFILIAKIAGLLTQGNQKVILSSCLMYGFSPAVLSGVTFIRMYMMLTFFCLLFLYVHCLAIKNDKKTFLGFYLPVILITYLGFLTHYYFIVFIFFVGISTFFSMLFIKKTRKHATCYAAMIAGGLLLAVMSYPACLSHIFRGYRGTEAQDAFFDLSNIWMRLSFFTNLLNGYLLAGTFFSVLLIILLLFLTYQYNHKPFIFHDNQMTAKRRMFYLTLITITGYFLIVAKTALLNAEEAIRYEMPVYGLIILLCVILLYHFLFNIGKEGQNRIREIVFSVIMLIVLASQIFALSNNKVLFLYEDDKENYKWAKEHANEPIVYIYSDTNKWMIWDESEELMQYKDIYFINMEHSQIKTDERLKNANEIYVYAARTPQSENIMKMLIKENNKLTSYKKVRELLYCDLYMLYK